MLLSNYLLLPLVALVEAREVLVQRSAAAVLLKWQRAAMMTPRASLQRQPHRHPLRRAFCFFNNSLAHMLLSPPPFYGQGARHC